MRFTKSNCILLAALSGGLAATSVSAQTPPPKPAAGAAETVVLSPFTVKDQRDQGYRQTNAITGSRIGSSILDTPLSISVVTRELIDDLGVSDGT